MLMAIVYPGCKQTLTPRDLSTTGCRFLELFTYTPAEPGTPLDQRRRRIVRMTELLHAEQEPYAGKVRTALLEACGVKERYA
jgi:hypothetical protein